MRIDRIEVHYVVLPRIHPWTTAYGSDPDVHSILVKFVSGDHEGRGRPLPSTSRATRRNRRPGCTTR